MINNVVAHVREQLPKAEQEQLAKGRNDSTIELRRFRSHYVERGTANVGGSDVDEELLLLYRKLLTRPPSEVDALINQAFKGATTAREPHCH